MQPTSICTTCGAELPVEARFCRNCGQRSSRFDPASVTEGTTRLLETPERPSPSPFNQNVYEHPGHLAHATSRIHPQDNPTSRNLETTQTTSGRWMMFGLIAFATIALVLTGLLITLRNRTAATVTPPVVTRPGVPPIHPPPPPVGIAQGTGISHELIYPGAQTTMEITDASEGDVLQLQTSDSLDKVASWYMEKLKPSKVVRMPGTNVILEADEMKAIITAKGDGTSILLKQGDD